VNYWLDLFTPYTWTKFQVNGASISGFRSRQRKTAHEKVKDGDIFVCYLTKLSRWCGLLQIEGTAFDDSTPYFAEEDDPFTVRFRVKPIVALNFEHAIPAETPELWTRLSFTREITPGSFGWGQTAGLRQSLVKLGSGDGKLLADALRTQLKQQKVHTLDAQDRRLVEQRTVVRTERGDVEVEVPDRVEPIQDAATPALEVRESITRQANVAELGAALGFSLWIPASDRTRVSEHLTEAARVKLLSRLPVNFNEATNKTIENIDVIWLQRNAIMHAFEIEHTTSIYSGLLRMADLLAMQPRLDIPLHIVAPEARRNDVRREILRPVFSVLDGGPMSKRCSYLSYDAIDQLLALPNLGHLRETILGSYEEHFDE